MQQGFLTVSELYLLWESELTQTYRIPDFGLVSSIEALARRQGVDLEDVRRTLIARARVDLPNLPDVWNPDLHPRGHDGKFIEKWGFINIPWLSDDGNRSWVRGQVVGIQPDKRQPGRPDVYVALVDPKTGKATDRHFKVKPDVVEQAPSAKARFPSTDPSQVIPPAPSGMSGGEQHLTDLERHARQVELSKDGVNLIDGIDGMSNEKNSVARGLSGETEHAKIDITESKFRLRRDADGNDLPGSVDFNGPILDKNGHRIGWVDRGFMPDDDEPGKYYAYNADLQIDKELQGQGIGTEVTQYLEDYWIAHRIQKVQVVAGESVGGYAWARAGFHWQQDPQNFDSADEILTKAKGLAEAANDTELLAKIQEFQSKVEQARTANDVNLMPLPFELSELGRKDGDETWIGKQSMLGSYWGGEKRLPTMEEFAGEPAPSPAELAQPVEVVDLPTPTGHPDATAADTVDSTAAQMMNEAEGEYDAWKTEGRGKTAAEADAAVLRIRQQRDAWNAAHPRPSTRPRLEGEGANIPSPPPAPSTAPAFNPPLPGSPDWDAYLRRTKERSERWAALHPGEPSPPGYQRDAEIAYQEILAKYPFPGEAPRLRRVSLTELPDALPDVVARRVERNAAEGQDEHNEFWAKAAKERNPKAFDTLKERAWENLGWATPASNPQTLQSLDDSIAAARANPKIEASEALYGSVPIVPFEVLPQNALGIYLGDIITVSEAARPTAVPDPLDEHNPYFNIDTSMYGTIRHEYGHHVHSMLPEKDRERWEDAYNAWGGGLGPDQVDTVMERVRAGNIPKEEYTQGLSVYGRTSFKEAFAETYSLVTHPDYDPAKVDPRIKPMTDLMEEFIGRSSVPAAPDTPLVGDHLQRLTDVRQLADVMPDPVARRLARNQANGIDENNDFWAKALDERNTIESRRAFAGFISRTVDDVGFTSLSTNPERIKALDDAIAAAEANPTIAANQKVYGSVPLLFFKNLPAGSLGLYTGDIINVSEEHKGGATADLLDPSNHRFNIDTSLYGTVRHEYGHHVESMLSEDDRKRWRDAYEAWGAGGIGIDGINDVMKPVREDGASTPDGDYTHGLSVYGRTTEMEGFAELYSLMTHPDFDPNDPRIQQIKPMVDLMTEFMGRTEPVYPPSLGTEVGDVFYRVTPDRLANALAAGPTRRRLDRDIANDFGTPSSVRWKQKRGYSLDTDMEQQTAALDAGDPEAFQRLAAEKMTGLEASDDPELLSSIDNSVTQLGLNPKVRSTMDQYGTVPVIAVKDLPGSADAVYKEDAIAVSEVASTSTVPDPLGKSEYNIDGSMNGTLRHEYGHHVNSMLSEADQLRWSEAFARWPGRLNGPDALDAELDRVVKEGVPKEEFSHGLSLYGRTNSKEAFAETYALVTHPDFDPATVDPEAKEFVDLMTEFITPTPSAPGLGGEAPMADLGRRARQQSYANDGVNFKDGVDDAEMATMATTLSGSAPTLFGSPNDVVNWTTKVRPSDGYKEDVVVETTFSVPGGDVGTANRVLHQTDWGSLEVHNTLLSLIPAVQGQGLGTEYTQQLEDYWATHGVKKMTVHAGLDVGGFAWARAGFSWKKDELNSARYDADAMLQPIINPKTHPNDISVTEVDPVASAQAVALLERVHNAERVEDLPTPFEISEVGRGTPDAERIYGKDSWAGKWAMLGQDWYGEKELTPLGPASGEAPAPMRDLPLGQDADRVALADAGVPEVEPIYQSSLTNPDTPRTRGVSAQEFAQLAAQGQQRLGTLMDNESSPDALNDGDGWQRIKDSAWESLQTEWGGRTFDAHTGAVVADDDPRYALTIKQPGMETVQLPINSDRQTFDAAMDQARNKFADTEDGPLWMENAHLGVFRNEDIGQYEIDPVLLVSTHEEVESIGAYTNATGGAYKFDDGNGYWPPYIAQGATSGTTQEGPAGAGEVALPSQGAEANVGVEPIPT